MREFKNSFKVNLNILFNLYRNFCFTQSGKNNEFTKEVGDRVQFLYQKGYLMSYAMGVAESCKSVVFTQKKIDELKSLGEDKMRKEAQKIQSKLTKESHKIIKDAVLGFKNNNEFFENQLERHNLIMDGFFFITSESKDFLKLSDKFKDMDVKKISSFYNKHLKTLLSDYQKRFKKSKNPYDQFVQPYEEPYVRIYLSKEIKEMYTDTTPYIVLGYSHGITDVHDILNQNKFYLLSMLQNKNISFAEKTIDADMYKYRKELIKYRL